MLTEARAVFEKKGAKLFFVLTQLFLAVTTGDGAIGFFGKTLGIKSISDLPAQ